jgi:ankyrin repeat protein
LDAIPDVSAETVEDALDTAALRGHLVVVQMFLAMIESKPLKVSLDYSLVNACKAGHVAVVRALIKAGADVNIDAGFHDGTSIAHALKHGHYEVVGVLLAAGADPRGGDDDDDMGMGMGMGMDSEEAFMHAMMMGGGSGQGDVKNTKDLFGLSVISGDAGLVKRVITQRGRHGCDFHEGLALAGKLGHVVVAQLLIKEMPPRDRAESVPSAIHTALWEGQAAVAEAMMKALSLTPKQKQKFFSDAAMGGCADLLKRLMPSKPDPFRLSNALYSTADPACIRILLNAKASVADCYDPLNSACLKHQPESVRMLLAAGARIGSGRTSMLVPREAFNTCTASKEADRAKVIEILLDAGAKLDESVFALRGSNCMEVLKGLSNALVAEVAPIIAHREMGFSGAIEQCPPALVLAIDKGDAGLVKRLLDAGASVDIRVYAGRREGAGADGTVSLVEHCVFATRRVQNSIFYDDDDEVDVDHEQTLRDMRVIMRMLLAAGAPLPESVIALAKEQGHAGSVFIRDIADAKLAGDARVAEEDK